MEFSSNDCMGQNYESNAVETELGRVSLIFIYALREAPIAMETLSPFGKFDH